MRCVHELFEEQVARAPDALALVCGTEQLTYAQLNARANQLAHYLIERGVGPDVPVAICVERSMDMVLGLLAILKAGGAYVPLDPTYPQERLRYMLEDSRPALVLLQEAARAALGGDLDLPSVDVQADATLWSGHSRANPLATRSGLESGHLVYIIYTSGSTGHPKGVMNEHRAVVNRLEWMQHEYALRPQDRVLQKTPFSFDVSVWEFFWPLLNGACLVMARPEGHRDPGYLGELIERERISVVHFVPSMLRSFIASGSARRCGSLRYVFCSGEELPAELQNRALASFPRASLHNLYGPTEAAVDVTYWACREQPAGIRVPIGRPIANTRIYVLDRDGEPVQPGADGEIFIGGLAVARGYWRRPELTAERFVSDPFVARDGARMYRTGDLGRWRADGAIEFLGRDDTQVKIHGLRIELGEIEAALRRLSGVSDAVVLAREDQPGAQRLVAYISAPEPEKARSLRERLLRCLPEYMVPAAFVHLEQLPLTASGKLDRRALPAPELGAYATCEYEPAQGEREEALAAIWQELLAVERVGRRDNFFALGGHSLLALSVIERLRGNSMQVDLHALFTHTDLAGLAAMVRVGEHELARPPCEIPVGCERITPKMLPLIVLEQGQIQRIVTEVPGGATNVQAIYPLAPLQQGVLFHHLTQEHGDPYVLSSLLTFQSAPLLQEFLEALQAVIDRHDILRTGLVWEGLPEPVQVVWRHAPLSLRRVSLHSQDGAGELWERFDPRRHRLDVRRAPLFEAIEAYDAPRNRWLLLLLFHHLAVDHTTLEVIFTEVRAHLEGRDQQLPAPVPFGSFVAQALRAVPLSEHEAFFVAMLSGIEEPTAPFGLLDVQGDGSDILEAQQELDADLARAIRACARAQHVTAASLYHLAWAQVLARLTGRADVVFGTVLFGRMQAGEGADRALGLFINTLPIRIPVGEESAQDAVQATHERLVRLLRHEHASLVTAQRCSSVPAPAPLFTTVLNYRYSRTPSFEEVDGRNWHGMQVLRSQERSNYPIALSVDDLGEGFRLTAQVRAALAPERLCQFMQRALEQLVQALTRQPRAAIRTLDVLPESERLQLENWNATQANYPQQRCLHELFEERAQLGPNALALVCEGRQLTYANLNVEANRLAHYLREHGVKPDVRVAICAEPSIELVVGLLAILKAGGAYVPLDPRYPAERLSYMLQDSEPALVLLHERTREALGKALTAPSVDLGADSVLWREHSRGNPQAAAVGLRADHLAYVIYTSGSTGQPKGVMNEHRGMVNRIAAQQHFECFSARDICCHKSSISHVDAVFEIFGPLCSGSRLVVIGEARDPAQIAAVVAREQVTHLLTVPSLARCMLVDPQAMGQLANLRAWTLSGEEIGAELLTALQEQLPDCEFIVQYGASEVSSDAALYKSRRFVGNRVPIGPPLPNVQLHVLDHNGAFAPIGVIGEIWVGGVGVARGYLNKPQLTSECFVRDRFSGDPHARLYATGDMGLWRPDGMLECLGRRDHQVKIRGFRVELGEIEAALRRQPGVSDAAVVAREDEPGEKRLVAYVTTQEGEETQPGELREQLLRSLPEHMVPAAYVHLSSLPLNTSGKLDRRALPAPGQSAYSQREYEPPRGEVEEILAGIWQELLKLERVGRNDNFFELGGHSLSIVQMLERLRRVGLSGAVRRVFESPRLADLAGTLTRRDGKAVEVPPSLIPQGCRHITPAMLPLVELEQEHIDRIGAVVPGGAANIQDIYPLAPLQEGILFHHLLNGPARDAYVRPMLYETSSRERLEELLAAVQIMIDRHDILRTAILWERLPRALQVVCRRVRLAVEPVMLDPERDAVEQLKDRMTAQYQQLDLRRAPLIQVQTAPAPDGRRWYALLCTHHLVCDNESLDILLDGVAALLEGCPGDLSEPTPYRAHVAQALAYARGRDAQDFFRSKLGDIDEPTAPFGLMDVRGDGAGIQQLREELEANLGKGLRRQARRLGVTAATLFHAAWALVISKVSGREDIVFGTVLSGRLHGSAGAQRVLGMFINTLPLRLNLDGLTAQGLIEHTQRELVELLSYEQASLAEAQRCSAVGDAAPLFTALLNYRHRVGKSSPADGPTGLRLLASHGRTNYPILLSVDDRGEGFSLELEADRRVDPQRLLGYMRRAVESLVEALERSPGTAALSLQVLPVAEYEQVVESFNVTDAVYPKGRLIHELFEEQAERTADAMAVVYEGRGLRYGELNARANQLARLLRDSGVGPCELVGICLERGVDLVVGLLAALKAGAGYVPLDPTYPAERLRYTLQDTRPKVVLSQGWLRERVPQSSAKVIALDEVQGEMARADASNLAGQRGARMASGDTEGAVVQTAPGLAPGGDPLAYVIHTSGSTGMPKGVMVPQGAVVNLLHDMQGRLGICGTDRFLALTTIAFDIAALEIFLPLLSGATVIVASRSAAADAGQLMSLLEAQEVTFMQATPATWRMLVEGGWRGRRELTALCGGEALPGELSKRLLQRTAAVWNLYGPTETTIWSCARKISQAVESAQVEPIGVPVANTKVYILDRHLRPVPVGVSGEIYIAGAGVTRGYLNRPDLTAERFVTNPFPAAVPATMYKSGDLGKWRPDGVIEYLGRTDQQVKIRGFRIELGEIEAQLLRLDEVKEAAVSVWESEPGERRLVGYVVAKEASAAPSAQSLREHLKGVLPEYMVPGAWVMLEALPLTANGKLDRRSLPRPDEHAYTRREYEAPQGQVEEVLAGIWQEVLNIERVGRNDNFFELGGHSLLIVQVLERLRRVGLSAEVRRVFDSPTLSDLAGTLMRGAGEAFEVPPNLIPPDCERITPAMLPLVALEQEHIDRIAEAVPGGAANIQDLYPLTPLQEGMLFHHLLDRQAADAYVVPSLLSVSSRETVDELIRAIQGAIERHDVLRTAIVWEHLPSPVQVVYRKAQLRVDEVGLQPDLDTRDQLQGWMSPAQQRLDLRQAPLIRLQVAQDPHADQWYVLLRLHHATCDRIAASSLTRELVAVLEKQAPPARDTVPYRNHVAQMLAHDREHDAAFFNTKLHDVAESTAPFGVLEVRGDGSRVREAVQELESDIARRVRAQARRSGVSAATLFHAAWALVVANTSGRDDVVFGTMLLGRLNGGMGMQQAVGMFINTLPLRLRVADRSAKNLLEETQRELIELLGHGHASLAMAQRCSSVGGSAPLFTALLNYRHSVPNPDDEWDSAAGVRLLAARDRTNYPITMLVDDLAHGSSGLHQGFLLTAQTDQEIDPQRLLGYMRRAVESLVEALERSPGTAALSLQVLPAAEYAQVVESFNVTDAAYPKGRLIHELFEEQVERTADAMAVVCGGRGLRYGELNARANQLARLLRDSGVGPCELVGICLERGVDLVVGLLAALKAGAGYVPLDPTYPAERLRYTLQDTRPKVVLSQGWLRERVPQSSAKVIALDEVQGEMARADASNLAGQRGARMASGDTEGAVVQTAPGLAPGGDPLAYVIHTSGSTGMPKGVMVPQGAVVNLLHDMQGRLGICGTDRFLALTTIAFDIAALEIFLPLLSGATVIVASRSAAADAGQLMSLLEAQEVTFMQATPATWRMLVEGGWRGRRELTALCGGEALPGELSKRLLQRTAAVWNLYGPTETTIWSCARKISQAVESAQVEPIGVPVANTKVYILDRHLRPVPVGVSGEIYIAGAGVTRGYLNRPDLTAERFVTNPFPAAVPATMYKSGDLGKWRPDGVIEYLGRTDQQVKIRGFRIELGEIEAALRRQPDVSEAAVLAREDELGEKRLVGYVVAKEAAAPSAQSLREHLKEVLPEYMVPSAWVMLEALPLTANGKLDRRSLPRPDEHAYTRREYEAPQGQVEEVLAGIWQEVLNIERVGRNDNFFELGGHSLLATRVMAQIRDLLGLELPLFEIFEAASLDELAARTGQLIQGEAACV